MASLALVFDILAKDRASAEFKKIGDAAGRAGKETSTFGAVTARAMGAASAAVAGIGIGAVLADTVNKAGDFDKSLRQIAVTTGASGKELASLRDVALDFGKRTTFSAQDASNAMLELARGGLSTAEIKAGALAETLTLASAGNLELGSAAEYVVQGLNTFNLDASQAAQVSAALAGGANASTASVESMGQALSQVGPGAVNAGLSIQETTAAIAAFDNAGIKGSDAGTSLKTMLQRLTPSTAEAAEAMQRLGLDFTDAQGNFLPLRDVAEQLRVKLSGLSEEQRTQALTTIFGSDATRAATVLMNEGAAGIDRYTAATSDLNAAQDLAKVGTQGYAGALENFKGAAETLQIEIGTRLLPIATDFLELLTDVGIPVLGGIVGVVADVGGAFADLPGPLKVAVVTLGAVAALKGPVTSALETMALKALYARDGFQAAGGAVGSIKAAGAGLIGFLGGPWGLAITGAVTGISLLSSALDDSGKAADSAASFQKDLAAALRESGGEINDSVRDIAILKAEDEKFQGSSLLEWAEKLNFGLPRVTDALLGNKDAQRELNAAIDAYAQEQLDAATAAGIAGDVDLSWVTDLKERYGLLSGQIGVATEENRRLQGAQADTADSSGIVAVATDGVTAAIEESEDAIKAAEDAVDDFRTALDRLRSGAVSVTEAEINLNEITREAKTATDDLSGSVVTATGKINTQSEAGAEAFRTLVDFGGAANDLQEELRRTGASADVMRDRDYQLRVSFIKTAQQMGIGKEEARRLADMILGVPARRDTVINTDTRAANAAVDSLQGNIAATTGKTVTVSVRAAGRFIINPNGGLQEFWKGGYTGPGGTFDVKGFVHADEFVVPKNRVREMGGPAAVAAAVGMGTDIGAPSPSLTLIHDTRALENTMESVANAVKAATPRGGVAGSGATGGTWHSLWSYVKARVPAARINSTYRPGDPGYHGRNKAIDFGYGTGPGGLGSSGLAAINRVLHDGLGRNLAELIYDGYGDDRPDLKNGRPLNYGPATSAAHRNHVHAAVYDSGGVLPPGLTLAYNGTGRDEYVTKTKGGTQTVVINVNGVDFSKQGDRRRVVEEIHRELVAIDRGRS